MYRESSSANPSCPQSNPSFLEKMLSLLLLIGYFVLLPIGLTVLFTWISFWLTADTFFVEPWMMPTLILFASFLGGALIRQKIEEGSGGMGLFLLGIITLIVFAGLTWQDIMTPGSIYSQFLPKRLAHDLLNYVFMLPCVGMFGMLFYKQFSLNHSA